MGFCIPKHLVVKLLAGAKSGDIDVKKMYQMTSEERRGVFNKYVDLSTAKEINAGFERAMASTQRNALSSWVKDTFVGKEAPKRKDVLDKVIALKEAGLLTPATEENFLQDLVGEKLGLTITAEEAQEINKRSIKLQEEFAKPKDKFGLPPVSYFSEKKSMDNYLKSLNPTHAVKVLTSVAGRGALLLSVKSPITNIIGNSLQAAEQSFERRIMSNQYQGKVDKSIIKEYLDISAKIYNAGEFDLSRADSYSDGSKTLGEMITHSQGKGLARKIGRFYEDVVFNKLMSKPDVWFAQRIFVDSANLMATKMAKAEGLEGQALQDRINQLFLEAASPSATTPEGMLIRETAKAEALFGTFQNDSTASKISLGIRALLNQASGDLALGDQIMPFVKTPANVISMSLDAGGWGFIKGTSMIMKGAVTEFRAGNPQPIREALRAYLRAGMGMLAAYLLSMLIDPEDFVGLWPTNPSEQELLKAKGGNSNMIRVGGKWISLDYFGFLGSPIVGFMYAKKYGKSLPEAMYNYVAGVTAQTLQIPGLEESKNLVTAISELKPDEFESMDKKAKKALISLLDQVAARVVPGASTDLAKSIDTVDREVDPNSITDKIKARIPGLRQTLPEKKDVFGQVIKGEPWYTTVLFGARVKTSRQTEVTNEMNRLDEAGQIPSLTRPEKTSPRVKELKEQIGDVRFAEAMDYFRTKYYEDTSKKIKSGLYKRMSDEDKKKELDKIKTDNVERMLTKFKYKKPKEPKKTSFLDGFSLVKKAVASEGETSGEVYKGEPFKVEKSDKPGYVRLSYPNVGGYSEIKKEKLPKYQRLIQDEFEKFGVGKYPIEYGDFTKFNQKEVSKLALAVPDEVSNAGAKNALTSIPLIQDALKEQGIYDKKVMAYALATTQHETGGAMKPVKEGEQNDTKYGYKSGFTGEKQAEKRGYEGGKNYYGRGFVQLTGKWNYKHYGNKIGVNLVDNPELANDPKNAAKILAVYIKEKGIDKLVREGKISEARYLVNPGERYNKNIDKGQMIANTYDRYLKRMPNYYE